MVRDENEAKLSPATHCIRNIDHRGATWGTRPAGPLLTSGQLQVNVGHQQGNARLRQTKRIP
jgi:hypothetical protein